MATLRNDAEVRRDVLDALSRDIRIDATRISVDVVNHVVTMRGIVPTSFEKRVAEDIVRRIKGVSDVLNELRVMPANPRPDDQIAADVRAKLAHDVWVDERAIDVDVSKGVVELSGTVKVSPARLHAEGDAWSVPGVTDVIDNIDVTPGSPRTDAEIAREVTNDIERNLRMEPGSLSVSVTGGTVYLRGRAASVEQKWLAEEIAWWTAGVRDVVNELQVGPAPGPTGGTP